jgi:hypothetical protein
VRFHFAFQLIFYLFLNNTTSKFITVPGLHFAPFLIAKKVERKKTEEKPFSKGKSLVQIDRRRICEIYQDHRR